MGTAPRLTRRAVAFVVASVAVAACASDHFAAADAGGSDAASSDAGDGAAALGADAAAEGGPFDDILKGATQTGLGCAGRTDAGSCWDFDEAADAAAYFTDITDGGKLAFIGAPQASSPPRSLQVTTATGDGGFAQGGDFRLPTSRSVYVGFDANVTASGTYFEAVTLRWAAAADAAKSYLVTLAVKSAGGVELQESYTPSGTAPVREATANLDLSQFIGNWGRVEIVVLAPTGQGGAAIVRFNGKEIARIQPLSGDLDALGTIGSLHLELAPYAIPGGSPWVIAYDDVVAVAARPP